MLKKTTTTTLYLENLSEAIDTHIKGIKELVEVMVGFSKETADIREEFRQKLHDIQAILLSPEVQATIKGEDIANPSEGTDWHTKNINNL